MVPRNIGVLETLLPSQHSCQRSASSSGHEGWWEVTGSASAWALSWAADLVVREEVGKGGKALRSGTRACSHTLSEW